MTQAVLIVGASTRAAAFSAIRAGWRPVCADAFADLDLRRNAEVLAVEDYPRGLPDALKGLPPLPWMYTGALENQPRIITAISKCHPLWGNDASTVRRVRDPWFLQQLLTRAGLPALRLCEQHEPPPPDNRWLRKPLRSGAGRGIVPWSRAQSATSLPHERCYFQEYREGVAGAALYLAAHGRTWLLGTSYQLIGLPELQASAFGYCGSVAPFELPPDRTAALERLGETIARGCGLRGLFGIDFISDTEAAWPVEINPRYTASVEVLERLLQVSCFDWHRRACLSFLDEDGASLIADLQREISAAALHRPGQAVGKAILFAGRDCRTPDWGDRIGTPGTVGWPRMADIPAAGTAIPHGHPICTTFAAAPSVEECRLQLIENAGDLYRQVLT